MICYLICYLMYQKVLKEMQLGCKTKDTVTFGREIRYARM